MQTSNIKLQNLQKVTDDFYIFPGIQNQLGRGAFGVVYRGYSKFLNKIIAIKHIQIEQNYEREIQTLKILSTLVYPHIMGFYGFQLRKTDVYMFVQYCPNGTLTDVIKKGIPQIQVLKYFRQLVEGMCYMNAKGKMHRDLKPDNILMGSANQIKISDFGLARQTSQNVMITSKKGTALYAAPQVFLHDDKYTQKCDVWGGGMILYEMLTGQKLYSHVLKAHHPFLQLRNEWIRYQNGQKKVKLNNNFHPLWQYFTNIMLTFDPKKRPTYHQILQILKKAYNKMETQITNQSFSNIHNKKLIKLQNYLNYTCQKYQILLKIVGNQQKDIKIKQSINFTIKFLCLSKYLKFMSKLIRDLKNKNLQIPDLKQDLIQNQSKDFQLILCMDKFRNNLQISYIYYNNLLKNTITKKLINDYSKNDKQFFQKNKQIFDLIKDMNQGMFGVQDAYSSQIKQLVSNKALILDHFNLQEYSQDTLKHYSLILIASDLNKYFPKDKFDSQKYVQQFMNKFLKGNKKEIINQIKGL